MAIELVGILLSLMMGTWVWKDALKRGKSQMCAVIWGGCTAVFIVFFFPLWIIVRPERAKERGA